MIIGKHQAYQYATCIYEDMDKIAFLMNRVMKIRFKERLKKHGTLRKGYIKDRYGASKQMRYLDGYPLVPIAYIRTKNAQHLARAVCNYTPEGRALVHNKLGVDISILRKLMCDEKENYSIEFIDNRVSLYVAQHGKCAILGIPLEKDEIHCHHRVPLSLGGTDWYNNLIIIHKDLLGLITATDSDTIAVERMKFSLNDKQLKLVNKLRVSANLYALQ